MLRIPSSLSPATAAATSSTGAAIGLPARRTRLRALSTSPNWTTMGPPALPVPAQRFGYAAHSGRIAKGFDADLVVLSAAPAQNSSAFSKVRYTIRGGQVIYVK